MTTRRNPWSEAVVAAATLVGLLLLIGLLTEVLPGLRLWGIVPRTGGGLVGVLAAPLLHEDLGHLAANAVPLLVLLVLLYADRAYRPAPTLAAIWVLAGLGTWVIGRGGAVHLGASSLVYGLAAYLVAAGWYRRTWRAALVAVGVVFLYGGLVYGVLPQRGPVSWEGHLCGALAGVLAARWQERHV